MQWKGYVVCILNVQCSISHKMVKCVACRPIFMYSTHINPFNMSDNWLDK